MTRWWLLWALVLSWLVEAEQASDWLEVGQFEVPGNTTQIVLLTGNTVDLDIKVMAGGRLVSSHNGPQQVMASDIIVLANSGQAATYSVYAKPAVNTGVDVQWQMQLLTDVAEPEQYQLLYEALLQWADEPGQAMDKVLSVLRSNRDYSALYSLSLPLYVDMLAATEQLQRVIDLIEPALADANRLTDYARWQLRRTLADATLTLDQRDKAIGLHQQLLADLDELPPSTMKTMVVAHAQGELGLAMALSGQFHGDSLAIAKGREQVAAAIHLAEPLGDPLLLSILLNNLWTCHALANEFLSGEKVLLLALDFARQSGSDDAVLDVLNHMSINDNLTGQVARASYRLPQVVELVLQSGRLHTQSNFVQNLANTYRRLGELDKAERYLRRALAQAHKLQADHAAALAMRHLGDVARDKGELNEAIRYHQRSLAHFRQTSAQQTAKGLLALATDYVAAGQLQAAQASLSEGMALGELILIGERIDIKLLSAQLAQKQGNSKQVAHWLDNIRRNHLDDLVPDQHLRWFALLTEHHWSQRQSGELLKLSKDMVTQIEMVRSSLDAARLGPVWSHKASGVISPLVEALMTMALADNNREIQAEVFTLLAQHQAINLRERRYRVTSGAGKVNEAQESRQLQPLWQARLSAQRQLVDAATDADKRLARRALDDATNAWLSFVPPSHNTSMSKPLDYLTISEVQQQLAADELLLRYHLGQGSSFAFVVSKSDWQVLTLPARDELVLMSEQLMLQLKQQQLQPQGVGRELTRLLPMAQMATGQYQRLLVMADDVIHRLPLAALNLAGDDERYRPLVREFKLIHLYAASEYLGEKPPAGKSSGPDLAVFADPVFAVEATDPLPDGFGQWRANLTRLKATGEEAQAVAAHFPELDIELVTREQATNAALMSLPLRSAKILHIATHGYFDSDTTDVVGLATAAVDEQNWPQPGFLSLSELVAKPFTNHLVVISGCDTHQGRLFKGEGLNSLTRGLLAQGAGSVISTLWPVSDRATAAFMAQFYLQLKRNGGNAVDALNHTQQKFSTKGKYKHPMFWAGFIFTAANRHYERPLSLADN